MRASGTRIAFLALALAACGGGVEESTREPVRIGPADGFDLPPVDTGRVGVGDPAPNFTLPTFGGDTVSLAEFRGKREVILVFYRGSW